MTMNDTIASHPWAEHIKRPVKVLKLFENGVASTALILMALLPVLEMGLRGIFGAGLPGSADYVQHLTLWVGFLGAALASREGRHLGFGRSLSQALIDRHRGLTLFSSTAVTSVALALTLASWFFVQSETVSAVRVGGLVPIWLVEAVLPISFAMITVRTVLEQRNWLDRALCVGGAVLVCAAASLLPDGTTWIIWPGIMMLVLAALLGAPLFVLLGGVALLLFHSDGITIAAIPVEAFRIVVSPSIPAIPLFTLAGMILAAGGTGGRLVDLFRQLFGWIPGGMVISTTLVCAFFSTFTGASGVTILALGGLLMPILLAAGYNKEFVTGLLTSTGSIGLLFPPSLAVILYAVVAHIPIPEMFRAGIVPGFIMVAAICLLGLRRKIAVNVVREKLEPGKALLAIWKSKWEVMLPVVVLGSIFSGYATLIEAAAVTALYAFLIEFVVHRDLSASRDLPDILVRSLVMLGGIFIILGVAMGLTNYLVDAMVPMQATQWVAAHVDSRITFLLALNIFLLIVGCMMDIYSAIVIVVPLILPISALFGIHPLHLGVIFLVNLELGYLTPPVGMNLFLAAYRFEKPMAEIYRSTLPFFVVLLITVLLITYVPWLIIGAN